MDTITLPAHYDGEHIRLDVPFELEPNTKLIVTVLPEKETSANQSEWLDLSIEGLGRAYGENEPDYESALIKQANPDYEGS
jgi:hypothetical protein